MLQIWILTILFSIATVGSILLLGSRAIIDSEISFIRILQILISWQFILGAIFALGARIFFVMINIALYKIPHLSHNSTTVTTLITLVAVVFVMIANYFVLDEKINSGQFLGAVVIFIGIFLVSR